MQISCKAQPDNLEKHIKQVMRENYASMENEVVNKCSKNIEDKYRSEFQYKLKKVENNPSNKDIAAILSSLKEAYSQSGLKTDSEILDKQLQKLDIQA